MQEWESERLWYIFFTFFALHSNTSTPSHHWMCSMQCVDNQIKVNEVCKETDLLFSARFSFHVLLIPIPGYVCARVPMNCWYIDVSRTFGIACYLIRSSSLFAYCLIPDTIGFGINIHHKIASDNACLPTSFLLTWYSSRQKFVQAVCNACWILPAKKREIKKQTKID